MSILLGESILAAVLVLLDPFRLVYSAWAIPLGLFAVSAAETSSL
ncbi:MAG: hypothetical protein AB8B55_22735 [Mariniblastus sp.]